MSSAGNNDDGSAPKQIALPTDVSLEQGIGEGDLWTLQTQATTGSQSGGGGIEPPKPAIRQRVQQQSSVHVTRSSSAGGGTISQQRLSHKLVEGVSADSRPLTDSQWGQMTQFATSLLNQTSSSSSKTSSSQHLVAASRTVNLSAQRFSLGSSTGGAISTSVGSASASQYVASASSQQSTSSSSSSLQRSSSSTTQQRTVTSRSQVSSSSSTRLSSSSISGQQISAEAAKALFLQASGSSSSATSALQLTGAATSTTITQRAIASTRSTVTTSSIGKFSSSSTSGSAIVTGDGTSVIGTTINQQQQFEGSSIQFKSSSSLAATAATDNSRSIVKTTTTSQSSGEHLATVKPTSSIAVDSSSSLSTKNTTTSAIAASTSSSGTVLSSLAVPATPPTPSDTDLITATITGEKFASSSRADDRGLESRSGGAKIEPSLSSGGGSTAVTSSATLTNSPTDNIWSTSLAEREIANKYLDKSFRSTSPSVGINILISPSTSKLSSESKTTRRGSIISESIPEEEGGSIAEDASIMTSGGVFATVNDQKTVKSAQKMLSEPISDPKASLEPPSVAIESTIVPSKGSIELSESVTLESDESERKNISSEDTTSGLTFSTTEAESSEAKSTANGQSSQEVVQDTKSTSPRVLMMESNGSRTDQSTIPIISATTPNVNYSAISTNAKNSTFLPLPNMEMSSSPQRSYPKKVFFIVVNEFCERFSFYGLRAVLVLYLRGVLGFSDADSTVAFHLFTALCYLTPIMGAILADSVWGKFKTILYLSIVYFMGEFVLVLSSIFWNSGGFSTGATIMGLILIGFGTGGIKPCVGALGGDQFYPHETYWRQNFFSVFYASINVGALMSMFITPLLRSNFQCVNRTDCFPYAFGLPCILMLLAIIVFTVAKNRYYLVPLPERNVLIAFCQCVWLAARRKFSGYKLPAEARAHLASNSDHMDTSSSNLSQSSSEEAPTVSGGKNLKRFPPSNASEQLSAENMLSYQNGLKNNNHLELDSSAQSIDLQVDRSHWLYLASDRFETRSIEDFRSVLGALLLMLPMPIYWCLFDQQGSLWTLQATRMDGRLFGTSYMIEPDQMNVFSPLLLLAAIPVFEVVIYPLLGRCNVLTTSIQRITTGGLLIALAFVASAIIELRIQQHLPPIAPPSGQASLLLVNGLSDCSLSNPMISYVQTYDNNSSVGNNETLNSNLTNTKTVTFIKPLVINNLHPLSSEGLAIKSANKLAPMDYYQISFQLTNLHLVGSAQNETNNPSGCPFSHNINHEMTIKPLDDKAVKLLYLEQGNGKLAHRVFDDSLDLPPSGKARVRLLYEFFGSATLAHTHQFYLHRSSSGGDSLADPKSQLKFHTSTRDGQVLVSQFMDVDVKTKGEILYLRTDDKLIGNNSSLYAIPLEVGTRNLIMVHQNNATNLDVKHQLLQNNNYRVSILYQLIPYLLLSMSEVLFSITGLDFCYSMAPKNMKSIMMAAFFLTATFGNLLTVAIESVHLFPNLVADYFFYAVIMVIDMAVFAVIGYYYKPRKLSDE